MIRHLVPRKATASRQSGLREIADRASEDAECQSLRCDRGHWMSRLKPTVHVSNDNLPQKESMFRSKTDLASHSSRVHPVASDGQRLRR
jgi:hypothetical protein